MLSLVAGFIAQAGVFCLAWVARRRARMMAVAVIFASQLWGLAAQQLAHDFAPLRAYAAIDLLTVIFFVVMAVYWHRGWLFGVAFCYVLMMGCHLAMAIAPISETLYIWVLNLLGYAALGIIGIPPLGEMIRGRHKPRLDFISAVRRGHPRV